jgi:hypothetical protein
LDRYWREQGGDTKDDDPGACEHTLPRQSRATPPTAPPSPTTYRAVAAARTAGTRPSIAGFGGAPKSSTPVDQTKPRLDTGPEVAQHHPFCGARIILRTNNLGWHS